MVSAAVRRATAPASPVRFRPDIEGLRGIAVLTVALWHAEIAGMPGGFTGVDVFFVVSGYLITGLLLKEYEASSTISLLNFYARRARRLLPAAVLMILVTLLACALVLGPRELFVAAGSGRAAAVYLSNVWFAWSTAHYFAQTGPGSPFVHTWSLAVEEQFYLVWPVLILLCMRIGKSRKALAGVLGSLSLVSFAACVVLSYKNPQAAFYHSPLRAWQFGIGALAVMIPRDGIRFSSRLRTPLGWLGLAGILACVVFLDHTYYPGWRGLLPAISTGIVLVSSPPRLLAARPLQWLGGLSYSWYLWHWPILILSAAVFHPLTAAGKVAAVAAALGVAVITHYFIENPIRFSRFLGPRPVLSLGMAAALTILAFGVGSAVRSFSFELRRDPRIALFARAIRDDARPPGGCFTEAQQSDLVTCSAGSAASVRHIVLFGDSHAMHWFPPIERVAVARGWRLTPITRPGCPSIDARRDASAAEDVCVAWREKAFEWITGNRPDLVIFTNIYPTDGVRGSHTGSAGVEIYRDGLRSTLLRFSRSGIPALVIRDSPHQYFDIPNCLARSARTGFFPPEACRMVAAEALHTEFFEAEQSATAGLRNVHLADFSSEYCPGEYCEVQSGDTIFYRDHQHFTRQYALSLAPLIEPQLQSILGL